jgi:hypothetical protein
VVIVGLALASLAASTSVSAGPDIGVRGLEGAATISDPHLDVPTTVSATLHPDGSARGYYGLCLAAVFGCASGLVDSVVPPATGSALWCVSGPRHDAPGRLILWIVNSGDGVSAFDRYAYASASTQTCTSVGPPANTYAFRGGDFKEVRVEVH